MAHVGRCLYVGLSDMTYQYVRDTSPYSDTGRMTNVSNLDLKLPSIIQISAVEVDKGRFLRHPLPWVGRDLSRKRLERCVKDLWSLGSSTTISPNGWTLITIDEDDRSHP